MSSRGSGSFQMKWKDYLERNANNYDKRIGRSSWKITTNNNSGSSLLRRRFMVQSLTPSTPLSSIHSPTVCLRRAGWDEMKRIIDTIPTTPLFDSLAVQKPLGVSLGEHTKNVNILQELPPDARNLWRQILDDPDDEKELNDAAIPITHRDLYTLSGSNWLNDEIINGYLRLLVDRFRESVWALNTFFYTKLSKQGFSAVAKWTAKVDIFSMRLVLIPLHLGAHWTLVVVNNPKKTVSYYDGLQGRNQSALSLIKGWLQEERRSKSSAPAMDDYALVHLHNIPRQRNGYDCGVFVCVYALWAALVEHGMIADEPPFSQADMSYFRRRIGYELLQNKLLFAS